MAIVLNDNGKHAALSGGLTNAVTHVSTHSATPDSTGSNPTSAARQGVSWSTPSGGSSAITTAENFTGGASNGAVVAIGLWSAVSGGTYYGHLTISGDQQFNSAGEYTLDSLSISVS